MKQDKNAWIIAAMHGITLDALLVANDLQRLVILQPGARVIIPNP